MALQSEAEFEYAPMSIDLPDTIERHGASEVLDIGGLKVSVYRDLDTAAPVWQALAVGASGLPYQDYAWLKAWYDAIGAGRGIEPFFVVAHDQDEFAFALPLAVEQRRNYRTLTFLGQENTNQNTGLWSPDFYESATSEDLEPVLAELCRYAGADLVHLTNVPLVWEGKPQPLLTRQRTESPSPVFLGPVNDDFDALFQSSFGKRSGKTLLRKQRKLEAAGDFRIYQAETAEDVKRGLDAFISQRMSREAAVGVPSGFSEPAKQQFLANLVGLKGNGSLAEGTPAMTVWLLEAGGAIRATYLVAWDRNRVIGYSTSIAHDELTAQSPGVVLLKGIIEAACNKKEVTIVDLGLGNEVYKHAWSEPHALSDCFLATSLKGRIALSFRKSRQGLKSWIRSSELLWKLVRKLRQFSKQVGA